MRAIDVSGRFGLPAGAQERYKFARFRVEEGDPSLINDDGKVDLPVTDDSSPNYLYLNKGDGTFEDASFYSGFVLNQDARETACMGLAVGDYTNNGRLDLYTTTFSDPGQASRSSMRIGSFLTRIPVA